jgi:hypothetical protein
VNVHIVRARIVALVAALLACPSIPLPAFAQSPPVSPQPPESTAPAAERPLAASGPGPAKTPSAAPPPPPDCSSVRRRVAFAAAGVAIAAAGAATIFAVLALDNKRAYERSPTYSNADNGNDDAAYADGAIALAVAAGVTSLVLAVTGDCDSSELAPSKPSSTRQSTRVVASPIVLAHGAGVGAVLRF